MSGSRNIISVAQMVNSFHVASAIYNLRGDEGNKLVSGEEAFFLSKWPVKSSDERVLDLYSKIVEIVRFNVKLCVIAKTCLEEMERFDFQESPSVSSNQNDNKNIRNVYSSMEFNVLRKVNLKSHSLNVLEEILREIKDKEVYGSGPLIIACILHDFGKSRKVREVVTPDSISENSSKFRMHPEVSGIYVKDVLYEKARTTLIDANEDPEIRQTIDGIADLVTNHHNASKAWKKKVNLINVADSSARKRELKDSEKESSR